MTPGSWFGRLASRRAVFLAATVVAGVLITAAAPAPPPLPPLSTIPGSPRLPGKFIWADLVTDNVPAASKFYSSLFGWTFQDFGNYLIAANQDRPLCGMFQRER